MKPVRPLLIFLLMGCTVIFGLDFKKVNVLSNNWSHWKKNIPTISLLHCSLQCENDRDLFGADTSCQAFTVMKHPGFCTMGYIAPALPPNFGSGGIEAWQEREKSCCLNVKVTAPPVRCSDFGGCPPNSDLADLSGTYKHSGYNFGPRGRPRYSRFTSDGRTFWLLSNQHNYWVVTTKENCDEGVANTDTCDYQYFSTTANYRSAECPGDLGPVWTTWSKNLSSTSSDIIQEMNQQISVICE